MPLSDDTVAYGDIRLLLNEAMASERGKRVTFSTPKEAIRLVSRINKFRQLDRKQSLAVLPVDDPNRGTTIYSALTIRRTDNEVIIEKNAIDNYQMEDL